MKEKKGGFGVVECILFCGFLVFLIIPMFTVITEKVYLKYSVHKINELADTAIMSSVFSIDAIKYSENELVFGNLALLEDRVYEVISMNSYESMKIEEFEMAIHEGGDICSCGCTSQFMFVHLLMKVLLERYGNKENVEFYIHRDLEFPVDR